MLLFGFQMVASEKVGGWSIIVCRLLLCFKLFQHTFQLFDLTGRVFTSALYLL